MRSVGWAGLSCNMADVLPRGRDPDRDTDTWRRPSEDPGRRHLSTSQGESPRKKLVSPSPIMDFQPPGQ